MDSPIFGGDSVSRSKNFADNQLWNLYPEIIETHDGKGIGALYGTPGLDLMATAGNGPIRSGGMSTMDGVGGIVYLVSGVGVYTIDNNFNLTQLGSLPNPLTSPVSMVNNGRQMIIFDGVGGYLVPGGYPLTGGTIGGTMTSYEVDDDIILINADGEAPATAQVTVTSETAGVITGFTVSITGAFNPRPTSFFQASTTGSGAGFVLTSPTYGPYMGVYTVPLPFLEIGGPVSGVFQDGFGLVNVAGTDFFYQSAVNDLSIWPVLFSSADATPDDTVVLHDIHRECWVLKEKHVEVWINAGQAGFSFQRLEGVFLEVGCAAPFSVASSGETMLWLSKNSQGQGLVVRTNGYQAIPVSTQAMDYEIQNYTNISDAIAYTYQQGGHAFYVLTFPSANATWCYDITASFQASFPVWHRRAAFLDGQFNRHWGNAHVLFNGNHLIGDYLTGNIYAYDLAKYTDNRNERKWLRSWRAVVTPSVQPTRFPPLQIIMETGINVPTNSTPVCQLRCSDDGGHTWPITRFSSVGNTGQTGRRVKFNRLGSTRRNSGLDRIFELSSTDRFNVAITGAVLE